MYNASPASRNLLKNGIVLAFLAYLLYGFVKEYLAGTSEGFTPVIFFIGLAVLGGGCIFAGILTLKAWKDSMAEAAAAIGPDEEESSQ